MDIDCGGFMKSATMQPLLKNATIAALVDTALTNLFTVQMRLGWFDPMESVPWSSYGKDKVNSQANQALALEAAAQGMVLLKNDGKTLPLKAGAKVAVVGPHAKATGVMQGNYHGKAPYLVSPCD
eukprot:gene15180-22273_t